MHDSTSPDTDHSLFLLQEKSSSSFLLKKCTPKEAFCHFIQSSSVENNKRTTHSLGFRVRTVCFSSGCNFICSYSVNSLITQNHFKNCSPVVLDGTANCRSQLFSLSFLFPLPLIPLTKRQLVCPLLFIVFHVLQGNKKVFFFLLHSLTLSQLTLNLILILVW